MDIPHPSAFSDDGAAAVELAVRAKLVEGYVRLVEATNDAILTLIYVARYGRHEEARVMAAREILERAHLSAEVRQAIDLQPEIEVRAEELRAKLDSMRVALEAPIEVEEAS